MFARARLPSADLSGFSDHTSPTGVASRCWNASPVAQAVSAAEDRRSTFTAKARTAPSNTRPTGRNVATLAPSGIRGNGRLFARIRRGMVP